MVLSDRQFLDWVADRLTNVYGESPNTDFVQRLRSIAASVEGTHRARPGVHTIGYIVPLTVLSTSRRHYDFVPVAYCLDCHLVKFPGLEADTTEHEVIINYQAGIYNCDHCRATIQ